MLIIGLLYFASPGTEITWLPVSEAEGKLLREIKNQSSELQSRLLNCKTLLVEERLKVDECNLKLLLASATTVSDTTRKEIADINFLKRIEQAAFELRKECPLD
jgi:hypothetical protein